MKPDEFENNVRKNCELIYIYILPSFMSTTGSIPWLFGGILPSSYNIDKKKKPSENCTIRQIFIVAKVKNNPPLLIHSKTSIAILSDFIIWALFKFQPISNSF